MSDAMILRPLNIDHDAELDRVRAQNRRLVQELEDVRKELADSRRETKTLQYATDELRRQLGGLYNALKAVFGELDSVPYSGAPVESHSASGVDPHKQKVWEQWKQKIGGKQADIIQCLLEHGDMTIPQIRVAAHCGTDTAYKLTKKLKDLGLLVSNGGKYSLKEL